MRTWRASREHMPHELLTAHARINEALGNAKRYGAEQRRIYGQFDVYTPQEYLLYLLADTVKLLVQAVIVLARN